MRSRRPILAIVAAAGLGLSLVAASPGLASQPGELAPGAHPAANVHASDRVIYHYDRAESAMRAAKSRGGGGSANMTYHGGKILPTTITAAILWGPSWAKSSFVGDKISGLDSWYSGFGNSNYAGTATEYTGIGGQVTRGSTYQKSVVDTSAASGGGNTSAILAEVSKQIQKGNVALDPSGNGYYAVYTDLPRGKANYCAWHSYGTIGANNAPVQFAFFWNLDGDAGCDPQDTTSGHSQGLAALANVSGHELAEAMTDPASPGAWYDGSGYENGDKCAWTFGAPLVTFSNKTQWKIQGEWSNAAYTGNTGYPNRSGQKGCLSGM